MSEQEQIVENYEEIVRRSGLVPKDQLETLLKEMLSQVGTTDSQILAHRLEEARYVTPWQNSKLMRGCYKGFFLGRYKLQAHLGTGGMSTVYLGEHTLMRRRVAIKVLHHKLTESHSYLERFYRESRATAGLDHENIVRAFDIDCQENHHYLVMEYVDGLTLKQAVDKKGPLSYEMAADYMRQAALGLQEAHDAGLIHRDVKPGNLMLNPKNVVKILDLGMALDRTEVESLTLKYNESMLGTADYLAPEQALNSHTVDARADVYALGCTLYFALTGHPPFDIGSMALRLMKHQTEQPPSIKLDRPDCPEDLLEIIDKMMAKRPKDRYQTMTEVVQVLERWLEDQAPDAAARLVFDNDERIADDDTVNDVNPYTLIGEGHEVGISKAHVSQSPSAQGRLKVTCPNCGSALLTKPPSERLLCKCPGCSGLMSVPAVADLAKQALEQIPTLDAEVVVEDEEDEDDPPVAAVPHVAPTVEEQPDTSIGRRAAAKNLVRDESARPANVESWKFRDMVSAMFDGDLRLVECIISMSVKSVGKESFAELMTKLLKAAVQLQQQREAPLEPQLIRAVVTALASNGTQQATLCLGRVVLGYIDLGPNDRLAAEAAIHAMVANPTEQREDFLVNAVANAEQARPRGRGRFTASELRATIASVFLKQASGRVRKGLRQRLSQPNLHAEGRTLIEQILRQ